jgi:hypothetical protein
MCIIRVTRKHIEEARKAREAALRKDPEFRLHEQQHERRQLDLGGTAPSKEQQKK